MEPNIIDYYNEMPHMDKVVENMNKELDELQNKYEELEKKYNELKDKEKNKENCKIYFTSIEDRNEKHKQMMDNIKLACDEWVDECPESFLYDWGFGAVGTMITNPIDIFTCIQNELGKLTDNKDWVYGTSTDILCGLDFFKGREMPHWNKIYNPLTKNDMKEILFDHIDGSMYENVYYPRYYIHPGSDDY